MDSNKINQLLIELHPRLECAHYFIQFKEEIKADNYTFTYNQHEIIFNNHVLNSSEHFEIIPNTISSFTINKNQLTFRVRVGKFKRSDDLNIKLKQIIGPDNNLDLAISNQVGYNLNCANCKSALSKVTRFNRICQLPSDNLNIDDWFCHKDSENPIPGTKDIIDFSLDVTQNHQRFQPQNLDLFYSYFYILINYEIMDQSRLRSTDKLIFCQQCNNHLGELTKKNSIKLWTTKIMFDELNLFARHDDKYLLFQLLRIAINDATCSYEIRFPPMCHVIFMKRNSNTMQTDFVSLQLMGNQSDYYGLDTDNKLRPLGLLNAMYRVYDGSWTQWEKDFNTHKFEVCDQLYDFLLNYLNENSDKYVPQSYKTLPNGYLLSYLILDDFNL